MMFHKKHTHTKVVHACIQGPKNAKFLCTGGMKTDWVSNHMKTLALEVGSAYRTWVFSDSFLFAVLEMCILNNH
jgi:hypothetical protein